MFVQKIRRCIKWLLPYGIIMHRSHKLQNDILERVSQKAIEIKKYFLSLNTDDPEIIEIINYFRDSTLFSMRYPYAFPRKYHASEVAVCFDKTDKMRYVMHENKRLYFPNYLYFEEIQTYYNNLCIEQDKDSPHRYESDGFIVQAGEIIADVGAAEGIWALNNAEKAGKIYLFECNREWIKALHKTFNPWKEKVVIVDKYVSNNNNKKYVTLDDFFDNKRIDIIKADIEGMEVKLLEGSKSVLANNDNLKLLLCAYHGKNDGVEIKSILEKNGFRTEYSKGYMIIYFDKLLEEPYIRRGLVRAMKSV
jgi:hypothetical protein